MGWFCMGGPPSARCRAPETLPACSSPAAGQAFAILVGNLAIKRVLQLLGKAAFWRKEFPIASWLPQAKEGCTFPVLLLLFLPAPGC